MEQGADAMTSIFTWALDVVIVVMLGIAWRYPNKATLTMALSLCLGVVGFREFALAAMGRALVQERFHGGNWTPGYGDGISDFQSRAVAGSHTALLVTIGLVVLVIRLVGSHWRRGDGSAPGNRK